MSWVICTYRFSLSSRKYRRSVMTAGLKPSSTSCTLRYLKVAVSSMSLYKTKLHLYLTVSAHNWRIRLDFLNLKVIILKQNPNSTEFQALLREV